MTNQSFQKTKKTTIRNTRNIGMITSITTRTTKITRRTTTITRGIKTKKIKFSSLTSNKRIKERIRTNEKRTTNPTTNLPNLLITTQTLSKKIRKNHLRN